MSMTPEEKRARDAENRRRYYEANKEKEAKRLRRWREANKEKRAEQQRRRREANKENDAETKRRWLRQKRFALENGSSFESWLAKLKTPSRVFASIANLQPDPGQTLTELIHELSGYAMEVCEQIANPPVIEDAPPAQPTPQPDLF